MEIDELRIGNLVFSKLEKSIVSVVQLNVSGTGLVVPKIEKRKGNISCFYLNDKDPQYQIEPLPIIEDDLIEFGFVKTETGYTKHLFKDVSIGVILFDGLCRIGLSGAFGLVYIKPIKYIHQLQNVYFEFSGNKLTKQTK